MNAQHTSPHGQRAHRVIRADSKQAAVRCPCKGCDGVVMHAAGKEQRSKRVPYLFSKKKSMAMKKKATQLKAFHTFLSVPFIDNGDGMREKRTQLKLFL
jgi:hypothetical protein